MLVIVYTDDCQVLLLKRAVPFEFWQSVTGSLYSGETPAAAAARELHEETGLQAGTHLVDSGNQRTFRIDPRWLDRYADGVTQNLEHEWHCRLASPLDIEINPGEHSDWLWLPIDEAIKRVWSWTNREALEALRSQSM